MHYGSLVNASYRRHYLVLFEATAYIRTHSVARTLPPCRYRLSAAFVATSLSRNAYAKYWSANLNANFGHGFKTMGTKAFIVDQDTCNELVN